MMTMWLMLRWMMNAVMLGGYAMMRVWTNVMILRIWLYYVMGNERERVLFYGDDVVGGGVVVATMSVVGWLMLTVMQMF